MYFEKEKKNINGNEIIHKLIKINKFKTVIEKKMKYASHVAAILTNCWLNAPI